VRLSIKAAFILTNGLFFCKLFGNSGSKVSWTRTINPQAFCPWLDAATVGPKAMHENFIATSLPVHRDRHILDFRLRDFNGVRCNHQLNIK